MNQEGKVREEDKAQKMKSFLDAKSESKSTISLLEQAELSTIEADLSI